MCDCAENERLINELRERIDELEFENLCLEVVLDISQLKQPRGRPPKEVGSTPAVKKSVGRPKTIDEEAEATLFALLNKFIADHKERTGKKISSSAAIDFFLKRIEDPAFKDRENKIAITRLKKTLMNRLSEMSSGKRE